MGLQLSAMSSVQSNLQNDASDALLLTRYFKQGDRDAMDELFKRHAGMAYRLAYAIVGNAADAQEVVQTAFLKVLLNEDKEIGHVRGWIMRIVVDTCHNKVREEGRRQSRQKAVVANSVATDENDAEKNELVAAAVDAVQALPKNYRLPVWLHYLEGLSFDEVARTLSIEENTVRQQTRRGIEQVRQSLAAAGFTASAVALPGLLASVALTPAPIELTESFKMLIATKAIGGIASATAPAAGVSALVSAKFIFAAVVLTAAGTFAGIKYHGDRTTNPKEDAKPVPTPVAAGGGEWTQWRGPTQNGIVPAGPKLLDSWPKEGPPLLWKSAWIPASWSCGGGFGEPVVSDGKVFVYASWRSPVGGGDKYRPFTAEVMRDWGYIDDMPEDLAKKIEEARLKRPAFNAGYHLLDYWMPEKQQDEAAVRMLKNNPDLDKYTHDFLATLEAKDSEKYGSYVKRRFCNKDTGSDGPLTWDQLVKVNAILRDKESPTFTLGTGFIKEKLPDRIFSDSAPAAANAWDRASKTVDTIICLDGASGKEVWKKEFPTTHNWPGDGLGGVLGPASTPTLSGGKLYVSGIEALYCLSAKDGSLVWQVKGGSVHSSLLVADGVLVYSGGNAAYDAETGKQLWKGGGCGNSSPVLWTSAGKKYVIAGGTCLDLHTGKEIWKVNLNLGYGKTPVISSDMLVSLDGVYKLTPEKAELVFKFRNGINIDPASSPVVFEDHIYDFFSWYSGDGWHCYDLKTGEPKWKQPDPKASLAGDTTCASPILVDGKIIHPIGGSHSGKPFQIEMLKATPEKYTPLGSFNPGICPMSSPVLVGGRLYLRLVDGVACYDLTAK
jgi:RNA polymerase sigma-70 factor (ECF subfamily)